ncbi:hypothetical protein C8Q73DRAFT_714565 [Cubamyces lactineus]|nr:hypothetical protein C8Q73DRAFT_714565 [Cubamyces lactineus]
MPMNAFQTSLSGASPLNLKDISEADARRIMSEEHKALGYRPPPGSLASQAQAAIARHESHRADEHALTLDQEQIRQAALADAERIKQQRGNGEGNGGTTNAGSAASAVDLNAVGEAEARKLMSDEHKALGYRPPPGSLAAEAQAAAAKHPDASGGIDNTILAKAALEDATHIAPGNGSTTNLDVNNVGQAEARKLMSEEHRALGYRPPTGSLAAAAQAAAAKHPDASAGVDQATLAHAALEDAEKIAAERDSDVDDLSQDPVTKEIASSLVSQEHKALGHLPESGSIPATAQSLADKNEQDGGERTLGEAGACM